MISVNSKDFEDLIAKFEGIAENIPQQVAIAGRKAGFRVRRQIAKRLAEHIKSPQKRLMKATYYKKEGNQTTVVIRGGFRMAIKRFKPKQMANGVQFDAYKTSQAGGSFLPGAFNSTRKGSGRGRLVAMGRKKITLKSGKVKYKAYGLKAVPIAKFGGQPMKRVGKARLPIKASPPVRPVSVIQTTGLIDGMSTDVQTDFVKEIQKRIRFLTMKKRGQLNWQKGKT
jgi:hypothetical protein